MLAAMKRTAPIEGTEGKEPTTLDSYGYTMAGVQVWWNPETQEKYTYHATASYPDGCFRPYGGPVIFGTGYTF